MFWSKVTVFFIAMLVTFGKTVDAQGSYLVKYENVDDRREPIDIVPAYSQKPPAEKLTSLTMYRARKERATLINTGYSVEVRLDSDKTDLYVTGPAVDNDEFEYVKTIFYWRYNDEPPQREIGILKDFPLQVSVLLYNRNYESYLNALNYHNGILEVRWLVAVGGSDYHNEGFEVFEIAYKKILKGGSIDFDLRGTNAWYLRFNPVGYYTYAGSLKNASTGEIYNCTIVIVPQYEIRLSQSQYEQTFLSTKNPEKGRLRTEEKVYKADGRTVIDVSETVFFEMEHPEHDPNYNPY